MQGQIHDSTRHFPLPTSPPSNDQLSCSQATCHETNRNSPAKNQALAYQAPAGAGGPSARNAPGPWPPANGCPQGGGFRYSLGSDPQLTPVSRPETPQPVSHLLLGTEDAPRAQGLGCVQTQEQTPWGGPSGNGGGGELSDTPAPSPGLPQVGAQAGRGFLPPPPEAQGPPGTSFKPPSLPRSLTGKVGHLLRGQTADLGGGMWQQFQTPDKQDPSHPLEFPRPTPQGTLLSFPILLKSHWSW